MHPPHPPQPSSPCLSPCLPVPSQAAAWQAANQAWQVARQCHRLTAESTACLHSFPPLCSPDLNPTALNLSPLHPPSCWGNIMPNMEASILQTGCLNKGFFFSLLSDFYWKYVFMLKVKIELWNNKLLREISQGVRTKGAFSCSRAAWQCLTSAACWEAFIKNLFVMNWARLNAISCILRQSRWCSFSEELFTVFFAVYFESFTLTKNGMQ